MAARGRSGGGDPRFGRKVSGDPAAPALHCPPKPPYRCARLEQRALEGPGRRPWDEPGNPESGTRVPGVTQSPPQTPGSCPPRAAAGSGRRAGAGERPPRPAARELCRRLAPARSGCSSFPGNFGRGVTCSGPRAPAQGSPGGRGERSRRPPPPALAPLEHASRCDPQRRVSPPGFGFGPCGPPSRWVRAPPLYAGWEGARAGLVGVSVALGASEAGAADARDRGLWWPSF